jgi:hypothetical protein
MSSKIKLMIALSIITILYIAQVVACKIRIAIPHEFKSFGPYEVNAVYGISDDHLIYYPIFGFLLFKSTGNRIVIYKNGDLIRYISIDLFTDFHFSEIRYDGNRLYVPDPSPGGGYWISRLQSNQSLHQWPFPKFTVISTAPMVVLFL